MEEPRGCRTEKREQLCGELACGDRNGRHREEKWREALMQLLHRENDCGDGGSGHQREAGRGAARHNISTPSLVLFTAEKAHRGVTDAGAHLHARSLGSERKTADEGKQSGKGKHEYACDPSDGDDALDGRDRGGDTTAAAGGAEP